MLKLLRSRKFARRTLLALCIIIIPAFVIWGSGSITKDSVVIGTIDQKKVTSEEFNKSREAIKVDLFFSYYGDFDSYQKILQNRKLMNEMAWQRLLSLKTAQDIKLKIGDRDVLMALARHPIFMRNGVFDQSVYSYLIHNLNMEPRQFEEYVRQNLEIQVYQSNTIFRGLTASDEEMKKFYNSTYSKVDVSYIYMDPKIVAKDVTATPEEIKNYYDSHLNDFYTIPEIELEYAEFPFTSDDNKKTVITKIEEIYPELKKDPKNFEEVLKKFGVPCNKTGLFKQDEKIPGIKHPRSFFRSAVGVNEGEISPPIFTPGLKGSVYIFKKIKGSPAKLISFDESRAKALEAVLAQKTKELAMKKAKELFEKIESKPLTLETAAQSAGLTVQTAKGVDTETNIAGAGEAPEMVPAAASEKIGTVLPPTEISNKTFIFRVDGITPPDPEGFENLKNNIQMNVLFNKRKVILNQWVKENSHRMHLSKELDQL
ncbi:MAG TPA: peptidylprolyl isomerase [Candidatus Omnitrophota bacterium]|nr:peptidylprolyl isomerase [Candidatus Omnitrophota bacterium]HPS19661.1 peptidylprolyl isomerase [Candidatus Omnitrophota bacterium]